MRFILVGAVLAIAGCNPPADYAVVGSADVPSVHGDIRIAKIDKWHLLFTVQLDELPPPRQIESGLNDYVLCVVVDGEEPQRQAAIDNEETALVGRASVPTSLRDFEMRITAESTAEPNTPSFLLVASQRIREN